MDLWEGASILPILASILAVLFTRFYSSYTLSQIWSVRRARKDRSAYASFLWTIH